MDVYSHALDILLAGAMPMILPIGEELHILTIVPNDRQGAESMFNPSPARRMMFQVNCAVRLHEHCTA